MSENFLRNKNIKGISRHAVIDKAHIYMKLFILLYADDTVIFSDNQDDLQNALNSFKSYCDTWKLTVDASKTEVIIISKGNPGNKKIKIGDAVIMPGT